MSLLVCSNVVVVTSEDVVPDPESMARYAVAYSRCQHSMNNVARSLSSSLFVLMVDIVFDEPKSQQHNHSDADRNEEGVLLRFA